MESSKTSAQSQNKIKFPNKKYLDLDKNQKELEPVCISTNLTSLKLNPQAIKGVYLYGCDLEEEFQGSEDFNPVSIMRKARKVKCFQEEIKKYVSDYYISGLILMGKPLKEDKKFKFYLKLIKEEGRIDGEILNSKPKSIENDAKLFKFKFKRKKKDLFKMEEEKENEAGDAECVANYLNICLGKILKKCGYTKDRTSRKILYYNKNEANNAKYLGKSEFLCFPALKAVCEAYEGGNIFMKILPKRLLRTKYTYDRLFYDIQANSDEEALIKFKQQVVNKRAIKMNDQAIIKIEDVIYENPFNIKFRDKNNKETTVGEYYNQNWGIKLINDKIPIAIRIIDKGGKLKGDDRIFLYIPCCTLQVIGNLFGEKIDIKDMVQSPTDKYNEIYDIRKLIEQYALDSTGKELHNYLGDKFDPLTLNGQIIRPPLIQFDGNFIVEPHNGNFDMVGTSPYSKIKELKKIDIYLLGLNIGQGEMIWSRLKEASGSLGIVFTQNPTIYEIEDSDNIYEFQEYLSGYFRKVDEYYKDKKNETDFIFLFMDRNKKGRFHYRVFKSVMNEFEWCIPTQVILFDIKKINSTNLSQFTNILCQMWAKKGNELYICDFSFIPKTIVVAYSSMVIQDKKVLTSISISIGTRLYEYMFYSKIEDNPNEDYRISPSIESLLKKALTVVGKHIKKGIENIVIYRDAVNEKQQRFVSLFELKSIENAIKAANEKLEKKIFAETKWCLILVSKINEVKMFLEGQYGGNNNYQVQNIPVGTIVDRIITHKEKYDFYLNSAESRQGTCSSTHYTILHDDTNLDAMQIYKLTYYLTYLSYNTTHSIRVPAPLYFVTRRNKFTYENLKGIIINEKNRTLNISL